MTTPLVNIPLDRLVPHPANSNVMGRDLLRKLKTHIATTGRYPPIIVRPCTPAAPPPPNGDPPRPAVDAAYQILDGHHRVAALAQLGRPTARCVVWPVDDDEALVLLATLNRLQGDDDPRKRAALVAKLHTKMGASQLAKLLPESADRLKSLLALHRPPPPLRAAQALKDMPVAVHFFLLPEDRSRLEKRLRELGGPREQALMTLIDAHPS